jgi:N-acyl-D-amino-acid deacylase
MFDTLLLGGWVVDGTGSEAFRADVGVVADRIAAIGDLSSHRAGVRVDVADLVVAPGFVDAHTHDDRYVVDDPGVPAKVTQGITTVVTGNCGISIAPGLRAANPPAPLDILGAAADFRFDAFSDYIDALDANPAAVNVAPLIGLTTLRVREVADLQKPASADEIARMRNGCASALSAGAFGVSCGTFYPPAAAATAEEVISVCAPMKSSGKVFAVHLRDEADQILAAMIEAFTIAGVLDVPLIVSHHKLAGKCNHGRSAETLALFERFATSQPVAFDVYPYCASSTMLRADRVRMSKSSRISWSQPYPEMAGQDVQHLAATWNCSIEEAVKRLSPGGASYQMMSQHDVDRILAHPLAMIGSDGLPHQSAPHPRLWGSFPRVLRDHVRERQIIPLESAVQKMSSRAARQFGIESRGEIKVGWFADIVVFDAQQVTDLADDDFPTRPSAGIECVMVNGQFSLQKGRLTGTCPGKRLQHVRRGR